MPTLDTLVLRAIDPERQREFYRRVLGMSNQGKNRLGYGPGQLSIQFLQADTAYMPRPSDLFWKIAISVPNIELAYNQLLAEGVSISEPNQFRDVGYLAQAFDPEGFNIEIIEHWFKGDRPTMTVNPKLLGGGPHISLLTLRTQDIRAVQPEIIEAGMKPLSIQPVQPHGFTLYFFAFSNDDPPNPQLEALENRTWVYRRLYTVLEIQHVTALESETEPAIAHTGYVGALLGQCGQPIRIPRLKIRGDP
jgi:predicted enzyme related to lactoylglutathione lyase